tara:strand:+ start:408 stop:617 length:210 start_codon:yes stop_codon:yes gene_type:complete
MPQEYVETFKESLINAIPELNTLGQIRITPVVKDPSASAYLGGFGNMTTIKVFGFIKTNSKLLLRVSIH